MHMYILSRYIFIYQPSLYIYIYILIWKIHSLAKDFYCQPSFHITLWECVMHFNCLILKDSGKVCKTQVI